MATATVASYDLIAMIWHDMQYVYIYITVLVHRVAVASKQQLPPPSTIASDFSQSPRWLITMTPLYSSRIDVRAPLQQSIWTRGAN